MGKKRAVGWNFRCTARREGTDDVTIREIASRPYTCPPPRCISGRRRIRRRRAAILCLAEKRRRERERELRRERERESAVGVGAPSRSPFFEEFSRPSRCLLVMGRKKKKQLKPWCWYPFLGGGPLPPLFRIGSGLFFSSGVQKPQRPLLLGRAGLQKHPGDGRKDVQKNSFFTAV